MAEESLAPSLNRQELSCHVMADRLPRRSAYVVTGPDKILAVLVCQPIRVVAKPNIAAIKILIAGVVDHTRKVIGHGDVVVVDNDVVQLVRAVF